MGRLKGIRDPWLVLGQLCYLICSFIYSFIHSSNIIEPLACGIVCGAKNIMLNCLQNSGHVWFGFPLCRLKKPGKQSRIDAVSVVSELLTPYTVLLCSLRLLIPEVP